MILYNSLSLFSNSSLNHYQMLFIYDLCNKSLLFNTDGYRLSPLIANAKNRLMQIELFYESATSNFGQSTTSLSFTRVGSHMTDVTSTFLTFLSCACDMGNANQQGQPTPLVLSN